MDNLAELLTCLLEGLSFSEETEMAQAQLSTLLSQIPPAEKLCTEDVTLLLGFLDTIAPYSLQFEGALRFRISVTQMNLKRRFYGDVYKCIEPVWWDNLDEIMEYAPVTVNNHLATAEELKREGIQSFNTEVYQPAGSIEHLVEHITFWYDGKIDRIVEDKVYGMLPEQEVTPLFNIFAQSAMNGHTQGPKGGPEL